MMTDNILVQRRTMIYAKILYDFFPSRKKKKKKMGCSDGAADVLASIDEDTGVTELVAMTF